MTSIKDYKQLVNDYKNNILDIEEASKKIDGVGILNEINQDRFFNFLDNYNQDKDDNFKIDFNDILIEFKLATEDTSQQEVVEDTSEEQFISEQESSEEIEPVAEILSTTDYREVVVQPTIAEQVSSEYKVIEQQSLSKISTLQKLLYETFDINKFYKNAYKPDELRDFHTAFYNREISVELKEKTLSEEDINSLKQQVEELRQYKKQLSNQLNTLITKGHILLNQKERTELEDNLKLLKQEESLLKEKIKIDKVKKLSRTVYQDTGDEKKYKQIQEEKVKITTQLARGYRELTKQEMYEIKKKIEAELKLLAQQETTLKQQYKPYETFYNLELPTDKLITIKRFIRKYYILNKNKFKIELKSEKELIVSTKQSQEDIKNRGLIFNINALKYERIPETKLQGEKETTTNLTKIDYEKKLNQYYTQEKIFIESELKRGIPIETINKNVTLIQLRKAINLLSSNAPFYYTTHELEKFYFQLIPEAEWQLETVKKRIGIKQIKEEILKIQEQKLKLNDEYKDKSEKERTNKLRPLLQQEEILSNKLRSIYKNQLLFQYRDNIEIEILGGRGYFDLMTLSNGNTYTKRKQLKSNFKVNTINNIDEDNFIGCVEKSIYYLVNFFASWLGLDTVNLEEIYRASLMLFGNNELVNTWRQETLSEKEDKNIQNLQQQWINNTGLKTSYYFLVMVQKIIDYSNFYYNKIKENDERFNLDYYKRVKFFSSRDV